MFFLRDLSNLCYLAHAWKEVGINSTSCAKKHSFCLINHFWTACQTSTNLLFANVKQSLFSPKLNKLKMKSSNVIKFEAYLHDFYFHINSFHIGHVFPFREKHVIIQKCCIHGACGFVFSWKYRQRDGRMQAYALQQQRWNLSYQIKGIFISQV